MSTQWESLANEHILGIAPYEPGKPIDELERELGIHDAIKLASNENPLPPSGRRFSRRSTTSTGTRTAAASICGRRSPRSTGCRPTRSCSATARTS